jgi:hypothetical protein
MAADHRLVAARRLLIMVEEEDRPHTVEVAAEEHLHTTQAVGAAEQVAAAVGAGVDTAHPVATEAIAKEQLNEKAPLQTSGAFILLQRIFV